MAITHVITTGVHYITVTGGTQAAPITWADIVAADTAGGWGVIETMSAWPGYLYSLVEPTILNVGDGTLSTYVQIRNCTIVFRQGHIWTKNNATLELGRVRTYTPSNALTSDASAYKVSLWMTGISPSGIMNFGAAGATIKMEGVSIFTYSQWSLWFNEANVICRGSLLTTAWGGYWTIYDSVVNFFTPYLLQGSPFLAMDRSSFGYCRFYDVPATVRNSYIDILAGVVWGTSYNTRLTFIDCIYRVITLEDNYHVPGVSAWAKFYYTLALTVQDGDGDPISGAAVSISQSALGVVYSGVSDVNGRIPNQELLYRYYLMNCGPVTQYIDTYYTPYTVTVSKPGFATRTTVLVMSEKRTQIETLQPALLLQDAISVSIVEDEIVVQVED